MQKMTKDMIVTKITNVAETVALTAAIVAPQMMANMAGEGRGLVMTVLQAFGGILVIPAIFMAIIGFYNYSMSSADGDGPAVQKAQKQIAAGIMMGVVAAALIAGSGFIQKLVDGFYA